MANFLPYKFGWLPDYPDIRDYSDSHEKIKPILSRLKSRTEDGLPQKADLRKWCSPVENQGDIGACTAHAVAGIVEYFERKSFDRYTDASRLFLYKVTRNLLHLKGDTGAYLKATLGALTLFGIPPEEHYPYETSKFDEEPGAFCYAFAQNYQCISYFRHDAANITREQILYSIKKYIAAGIPAAFGFTVYSSIRQADNKGLIPFPARNEKLLGGHAVAAVGYDDSIVIENNTAGYSTTGALLIRNSWGEGWGEDGYGWLPYEYVLKGLAQDWWSILKQEWIDTAAFTIEEG